MGRRDGFEGGLPPMPWKEGLKHDWDYVTVHFGGGVAYEVYCKRCGEGSTNVRWDDEGESEIGFPKVETYGCRPDADRPIERWD